MLQTRENVFVAGVSCWKSWLLLPFCIVVKRNHRRVTDTAKSMHAGKRRPAIVSATDSTFVCGSAYLYLHSCSAGCGCFQIMFCSVWRNAFFFPSSSLPTKLNEDRRLIWGVNKPDLCRTSASSPLYPALSTRILCIVFVKPRLWPELIKFVSVENILQNKCWGIHFARLLVFK